MKVRESPKRAGGSGYYMSNLTFRDQYGAHVVFPGRPLTAASNSSTYSCNKQVQASGLY